MLLYLCNVLQLSSRASLSFSPSCYCLPNPPVLEREMGLSHRGTACSFLHLLQQKQSKFLKRGGNVCPFSYQGCPRLMLSPREVTPGHTDPSRCFSAMSGLLLLLPEVLLQSLCEICQSHTSRLSQAPLEVTGNKENQCAAEPSQSSTFPALRW